MIFDRIKKICSKEKGAEKTSATGFTGLGSSQKKSATSAIVKAVKAESLTYIGTQALKELYERIATLEEERIPGILVEAGCALGGSAIVMATAKSKNRTLNVYDVFGMIPPPSDHDGEDVHKRYEQIKSGKSAGLGQNKYYGYEEDLLAKVGENFRRHQLPPEENNVHFIKGLFQDTLQISEKVALAHIDGDWYESVRTCLERIVPHIVSGGALVIDDYDAYSGCAQAVNEYFADKQDRFAFIRLTRLHILRK
jgi:asparagine synthase (glutamine-hydrolysing)